MRLSVLLFLALFLVACSDELTTDEGDLIVADLSGAVRIPLLASAADGTSYRLKGATFEISGSAMVTLSDSDTKGAEELVSPLPAGGYSMYLRPGWELVSITADGTTTTLTATSMAKNPIGFNVTEAGTASPELVFKVGDRELSFGRSGVVRLTSLGSASYSERGFFVLDASATTAPRVTQRARFVLWVCLLGIFVSNITLTIVTVALPTIATELGADPSLTNWVTFGPMLVVALFTTPAGRAADNYGRKRIWLWGFGLSLVGMLGSALAPTLPLLICARLITGLGTALLVPAALAISTALYPPRERAIPVGYWTSTVAISPLVGVIAGGYLLEHMSYRWLFAWQVALGLPAFAAAWVAFPEQRYPSSGRFDWEGSAAIAAASVAAMVGATWLGRFGALDVHVFGAALGVALASAWAVSAERRAQNPVIPPFLLRDAAVSLSVVARLTLNFAYMGAFMTLPYLLQELWHYSPARVSLLMVFRPLAMGLAGPISGRLVMRVGAERLMVWGAWAILISTAGFVGLDATPNVVLLIAGLAVAGAGLGMSSPGSVAVVTQRVGPELLGTVSGLMTLTATLGNALGMAGLFAVVEVGGGVHDAAAYRLSFLAGTAVTALGLYASLRLAAVLRAE